MVCRCRTRPRRVGDRLLEDDPGLAAADHLEVVLPEVPHLFLRPGEVGVGAAHEPVDRGAVGLGHGPVREEEAALLVLREDEVRHEVDDLAEPGFRLAQGPVGATRVGDVQRDPHRAADGARRVAQGLDVHGEGAALVLVLVAGRLAAQREPVALEGHVVGPEVLLQRHPDDLVRGEAEGGEARAQRRGEAQLVVRRPQHGRDLLDRHAQPGLALPQRVLRPLRLDRGGDLARDEHEEVPLFRPEAHRAVVGLDGRHPDHLASRQERRPQPVHGVAGDELDLAARDEAPEDLGRREQGLAGAQDVLRQAPPERLRGRGRVALVGEVGEAHQARRPVVEGDVEVPRGQHVAQALVDRAEERRRGPTPSGRPRRCGTRRPAPARGAGRARPRAPASRARPRGARPRERGRGPRSPGCRTSSATGAGRTARREARSPGRSRPAGRRRRARGRDRRRRCPRAPAGVSGPGWRRPRRGRRHRPRDSAPPSRRERPCGPGRARRTTCPPPPRAPVPPGPLRAGGSSLLARPQAPSRSQATCR